MRELTVRASKKYKIFVSEKAEGFSRCVLPLIKGDKVAVIADSEAFRLHGETIKALLADTHTLLPLSTVLHGEYGANDLCMGVPCIVGGSGLEKVVELPVTAEEKAVLDEKVASLNATYDTLGIRK